VSASQRRWTRPSPWLWGLVVLLAIAGIAVTQEPKPTILRTPSLSGPVYTPAMVLDRSFRGADLNGARLMHLDLRGKDFQDVSAAGAIFAGSLLNGANFSYANLRGADFRGTCLRGADLIGAQLAGVDFTDADVTGATVSPGVISETIGWTRTRIPQSALKREVRSRPTSVIAYGRFVIERLTSAVEFAGISTVRLASTLVSDR
jgi:hypothetical protein